MTTPAPLSALHSNWQVTAGGSRQYASTAAAYEVREMYAALILNAIESVANPGFLQSLFPSTDPRRIAAMREKDRQWLLSNRRTCRLQIYTFVSFLQCCDALGLDPDYLRENFQRRGWLDGTGVFGRLVASRIVEGGESEAASG
jgi:hypothetical protein